MPLTPTTQQELIDCLQAIALHAQRLDPTTKEQQQHADALLDATKRAIALVTSQQEDQR